MLRKECYDSRIGPMTPFAVWAAIMTLAILSPTVVRADPPVVDSVLPGISSQAVLSHERITASFSLPMDTSSLNDTTFLVSGSASGVIRGTFDFDTTSNSATFAADSLYASAETVYVELTTAIQSIFGDTLESAFTWAFYTCESPTVVDRDPGVNAINVPTDLAEIRVTFSRAMDTSSITGQTFIVWYSSQEVGCYGLLVHCVEGVVHSGGDVGQAIFELHESLPESASVYVQFSRSIRAEDGCALTDGNRNWFFFTYDPWPPCAEPSNVESDYDVIHAAPSALHQTEVSIAADPSDWSSLIIGANRGDVTDGGRPRQRWFASVDYGDGWESDEFGGAPEHRLYDPAVAFNAGGMAFYCYCWQECEDAGGSNCVDDPIVYVRTRPDPFEDWGDPVPVEEAPGADKPHLAIDFVSPPGLGSSRDNVYAAYSASGGDIFIERSINDGELFIDKSNLSDGIHGPGGRSIGVNLAVGPDGTVYAAWLAQGAQESGIAFSKSTDGGETWEAAEIIVEEIDAILSWLPVKEIRANSYPVLAIDTTDSDTGIIYLVWAAHSENNGTDIFMIKSHDGGATWDDVQNPARVNDDTTAYDQWSPWVTVDPGRGVNVVFYDCRDSEDNLRTQVWMARSDDFCEDFTNVRVSDVEFTPCAVNGSYMGDYIGIASSIKYVHPCWNDNRYFPAGGDDRFHNVFVAKVPLAVTGSVTADTTWKGALVLWGSVSVPPGVTLIVASGTIIECDTASLTVFGSLVLEGSGDLRPKFVGRASDAGSWGGIVVESGGSIDWGGGAVISDAQIAVRYEEGAENDVIAGVRVENCRHGFSLGESVQLLNDTLVDVDSIGIYFYNADAEIESCRVEAGVWGIYAIGTTGTFSDNLIEGSAQYGIYATPGESGTDTLNLLRTDINGYFSKAHLRAGTPTEVDSCEFVADSNANGNYSPYGIKVTQMIPLKMRHSKIVDYDSVGYFSDGSWSDLGDLPDSGFNSIYNNACSTTCLATSVWESGEGPLGPGGGEPIALLQAEGNWWGTTSPSYSLFEGSIDYTPWLTYDPVGKRAPIAFEEVAAVQPSAFSVGQNYPNPFNPATTISFSLPVSGRTRVEVFNILGQRVRELIDAEMEAGPHQVVWDGADDRGRALSSGVYLYRISAGDHVESKKMVLLK